MKYFSQLVCLSLVLSFSSASAQESLVDIAASYPQLSTLVSVLQQSGLDAALQGPGPFTVFAPTNQAFAAIPATTLERITADPQTLRAVLGYHVVAGALVASNVANTSAATTLHGEDLVFRSLNGSVTAGGATVTAADLMATNGVLHFIDRVLLPPSLAIGTPEEVDSISSIIAQEPRFSTLATALEASGMLSALSMDGEYTLFAPTDQAFARLDPATLEALLADPEALRSVLAYHVLVGRAIGADLVNIDRAQTLEGSGVNISVEAGNIRVDGATVTILNLIASNGVIQGLDSVLLPPGM